MRLYDSFDRVEKPIPDRALGFYACGVTVYDYCHIGHARSYVVWDFLKRWLRRHHQFRHVQNFTDVDDKIIKRAASDGVSALEIADRFIAAYHEDMQWLNVMPADEYPRVLALMPKMLDAARRLIDLGHAYEENGDIRFRTHSHSNYGKLSGREPGEDFALWKGPKPNEPEFPNGRPGWHLECSVMIEAAFGGTIDIHGGGNDLIFPHHENEIAQSECLHNRRLANHWVHNGMVEVEGGKMGKSLGNAFNIRDYRSSGVDPNVIRYWIAQAHYRKPLAKEPLDNGSVANQWASLKERLRTAPPTGVSVEFESAMNDDMNTPRALSALFKSPTLEMADILGFRLDSAAVPHDVLAMWGERNRLRAKKDWAAADAIKKEIIARGFQLRDNPDGSTTIVK